LRRAWPEILQTLTKIKRSTWALVEPNAQVGHFEDHVLTLAFTTSGLAGAFGRADHADNLRQAIHKTIGIDCQIRAVAGGGNSPASSEPNPKAPVSRDTPATSADAAWGLSPAPQPASAPGNASAETVPAEAPAPARVPAGSTPGTQPAPALEGTPGSGMPAASGAPTAEPQASASPVPAKIGAADQAVGPDGPPEPSGSYADPDDDWGPPLDEDAPPLDEEPPMDWDPTPAAAPRRAEPATPAPARKSPEPAASGAAGPPAETSPADPESSADPWARAVEHSPGVWNVGTDSNIGGYVTPDAQPAPPVPEPEPVHYEPAAAQMPEYAGVVSAPSALVQELSVHAQSAPAPAGPQAAAPRVTATALAAPPAPAAAVPEAAASPSRQSLYQRLSNSPEAEAGRAKAPARAAAPTVYVQDIPSADDETIEESGVFGRAAVERILGGKLVEERSLDGSPLPPRF
jgi:DNA polymerase-3 subunit gamma/tau